jgi:cation diffusion facilitator family transporter
MKMKQKIAVFSVLINAVLAGGKIWVGFISNSSAVLAEGFHSLTDIFSSLIGYFGIKASEKPVDKKHPYGHYKFEVLSGAVITLILFSTGAGVIYEAYQSFSYPNNINVDLLVIGIMILSVVINYAASKIKIYYGKKENSLTLLSDGTHDKADVLSSLAVLAGLFLTPYFPYIDSILAFFVGLYIIKESFSLGKEAIDSLLDVSAGEEIEAEIHNIAKERDISISELKTQKRGSAVTANLEIILSNALSVGEATKISDNLRQELLEKIESLKYVIIGIKSHEVESSYYRPLHPISKLEFGKGFGWQRRAKFQNDIKEAQGKGPQGDCVCPECGYSLKHEKGIPCSQMKCPRCKIPLERK